MRTQSKEALQELRRLVWVGSTIARDDSVVYILELLPASIATSFPLETSSVPRSCGAFKGFAGLLNLLFAIAAGVPYRLLFPSLVSGDLPRWLTLDRYFCRLGFEVNEGKCDLSWCTK